MLPLSPTFLRQTEKARSSFQLHSSWLPPLWSKGAGLDLSIKHPESTDELCGASVLCTKSSR